MVKVTEIGATGPYLLNFTLQLSCHDDADASFAMRVYCLVVM